MLNIKTTYKSIFIMLFLVNSLFSQQSAVDELLIMSPKNVMACFGTSGIDRLKSDIDKTTLGEMLNDPEIAKYLSNIDTIINALIEKEVPSAKEMSRAQNWYKTFKNLFQYPVLAGLVMNAEPDSIAPFYSYIIIKASRDDKRMQEMYTFFKSIFPKDNVTIEKTSGPTIFIYEKELTYIYATQLQDYYVLVFSDYEHKFLQHYIASANKKADIDSTIKENMKHVKSRGDLMFLYADFKKIAAIIKKSLPADLQLELDKNIKAIEGLGVTDISSLLVRAGIKDKNYVFESFLAVPNPNKGLLKSLEPVDGELFDLISGSPLITLSFKPNYVTLYDTIIKVIENIAPSEEYDKILNVLQRVENQFQISVRNELLSLFSNKSIISVKMPDMPMPMGVGNVNYVMKLSNADEAKKTVAKLEQLIKQMVPPQFVNIYTQQRQGYEATVAISAYLSMAQITPCWAVVKDKYLVFSSNLMAMDQVVQSFDKTGDVLTSHDEYKIISKTITDETRLFEHLNSKMQVRQALVSLQQLWPMIASTVAGKGVELPALLPDFSKHLEKIEPSFTHMYYSKDGVHLYQENSLGVSLGSSLVSVSGAAMGVSVLMPALARAREMAKRVKCASHLRHLAQSILVYCANNDGKMPASLNELVIDSDLGTEILECPSADNQKEAYIYRGNDLTICKDDIGSDSDDFQMILIYESLDNHQGDMCNMVFMNRKDGNVEIGSKKVDANDFQRYIDLDNKYRKILGLKEKL